MRLNKYLLIIALTLAGITAQAQILNPVKWTWKAESLGKSEFNLVFTATIEPVWHVYSQKIDGEGPIPTTFKFAPNKDIELVGKTTEAGGKVHEGFDPIFEINLKYFENKMVCVQKVKVLKDTQFKGSFEYMACDDHQCLPPSELDFSFDLKKGGTVTLTVDSPQGAIPVPNDSTNTAGVNNSGVDSSNGTQAIATERFGAPLQDCGTGVQTEDKSLWAIIVLGFLGGLAALLTPCVFPMIPLTVTFFTKRNENKGKGIFEAFFYGFCIVFIYFLLAVPFLFFDISSDKIYEISTGPILNLFFFIIFVIFAISFFGYFEITLPSFIANKADSASNVGGLVGIFFMALTLSIVSFSCTGPIVGSLLVGALNSANGKVNLIAGMSSFGFALALPFALFALFPKWMKAMPKSGGWLNTVKVILAFVELIFAVKFLSNADLVGHWGILKREVFLALWALAGLGAFFYLIGKIKFPHDSPIEKLSKGRMIAAAVALAFTAYSAFGIPGNTLTLFSGFPPPKFYSFFNKESSVETIHNNYDAALALAKKEGKPVMIDFTGYSCVNCRKMEENVWPDLEVKKRLMENYIVVSLYCDERTPLPEEQQYMSDKLFKKIKTQGDMYNDMQATYFGANAQPYYVLVSPDEKLLTQPAAYTPDIKDYVKFLDCGLNAFKQYKKNKPVAENL
jgi:thiol:disulfide interchange protein